MGETGEWPLNGKCLGCFLMSQISCVCKCAHMLENRQGEGDDNFMMPSKRILEFQAISSLC